MLNVVYLECVVAGLLRLWLMNSQYKNVITDRVEVSTPLNSWKKVTEGIFLYNHGIDPYVGDLFHDIPLNLQIYKYIIQYCDKYLQVVFVLIDILTAYLLYKTAIRYLLEFSEEEKQNKNIKKDGKSLLLKDEDIKLAPTYVVTSYLFNPYIIFNCVGMTTTTFTNFLLAVAFFGMIHRSRLLSCFGLAFATCQCFYPLLLIVPASIYISKNPNEKYTKRKKIFSFVWTFTVFVVLLAGLLFISKYLSGSWNFLYNMYGFILNVPDLRPNIGLFWYFFTEMFEHFRALFISAFQINATLLYLVPLTLRLHDDPMLLAVSISALTSIFRSYPSLGDVGLYLSLYPMWKHLFNYMQQGFIIGCFFLITSVLGPTVWHLWIYARSANANFYFGVTLAFATAQIFLLTDILFAYIKRDFSLEHGLVREIKGKTAKLVLE